MKRRLTVWTMAMALTAGSLFAQNTLPQVAEQVITFRFVAGNDMFYIPWAGNGGRLDSLCRLVDVHRAEIAAGRMPVYVDGYCASMPTPEENLRTAIVRSNRVKSELIVRSGLTEEAFVTANRAAACNGLRDVVVVTLRLPRPEAARQQPRPENTVPPAGAVAPDAARPRTAQPDTTTPPTATPDNIRPRSARAQTGAGQQSQAATQPDALLPPFYTLALRTNLLYDALLMPTLGIEWRISPAFGIKLDGSLSRWGDEHGKVQKLWMLNPEVRWYLLRDKRFYAGVSATYGEYNLYGYPLGKLFSGDTSYQGKLWGAGVTVGCQLPLTRCIALDFNLGLGYTRSEYDSFRMKNNTRVIRARDRSKNFFGPTQAGISLIWTIGNNK